MVKLHLVLAAGTLALMGAGISTGALASPYQKVASTTGVSASTCDAGPGYVSENSSRILSLLKEKGVNANMVNQWGGCVQAFVTNTSGAQSIELFTPYTLWHVTNS